MLVQIYKIWFWKSIDCYIGSTSNKLSYRISQHIHSSRYNIGPNKLFKAIRENEFKVNYNALETKTVKNDLEKRQLEQKWIDQLKPNLNTRNAYVSTEDTINKNRKHTTNTNTSNRVSCHCGGAMMSNDHTTHIKTNRHQKFVKSIEIRHVE